MPMLNVITTFTWSGWHPLEGCWLGSTVPATAGLYRIRRIGSTHIDYIGQTGKGTMTLRKRLGMLRGVFGDLMPYRDPHTAGPALWALRHSTGCAFEVSTVTIQGSDPWRKGLEALAIALYREQTGHSPIVNFGRMPAGYVMSSGNNAYLKAAGKFMRGGPNQQAAPLPVGIGPTGPLTGEPTAATWGGHSWTSWLPLEQALPTIPKNATGLYRIRHDDAPDLLYIGQGLIAGRLAAHYAKMLVPDHVQGQIFAAASPLEVSWMAHAPWLELHRLELENDLIGAHVLTRATVPAAQFLG